MLSGKNCISYKRRALISFPELPEQTGIWLREDNSLGPYFLYAFAGLKARIVAASKLLDGAKD